MNIPLNFVSHLKPTPTYQKRVGLEVYCFCQNLELQVSELRNGTNVLDNLLVTSLRQFLFYFHFTIIFLWRIQSSGTKRLAVWYALIFIQQHISQMTVNYMRPPSPDKWKNKKKMRQNSRVSYTAKAGFTIRGLRLNWRFSVIPYCGKSTTNVLK